MSDERIDATIDEVAREMTRGDVPPDFRARVIARLERGDEKHWTWRPALVLSPLAVAAIVLLAVLVGRAPWRSGGPPEVRQDVRVQVPGDVVLKPVPSDGPSPLPRTTQGLAADGQSVEGPNPAASRTPARVTPMPDTTYAGGAADGRSAIASDLAPPPIQITTLEVEAMESMDVEPLSVDTMESIGVPGLDVAPLEVPAIGE
jgi:hypothetical protein